MSICKICGLEKGKWHYQKHHQKYIPNKGRFINQNKLITKKCESCGAEFESYKKSDGKEYRFCCVECATKWLEKYHKKHRGKQHHLYKKKTFICEVCGKEFIDIPCKNRRVCSYSCATKLVSYDIRLQTARKSAETNRIRGNFKKSSERMRNGGAIKALQGNFKTPRISMPQIELYNLVKIFYPEAQLEYNVENIAMADIAIPSLKIDIEYDGYCWHKNKTQQDKERDMKLLRLG